MNLNPQPGTSLFFLKNYIKNLSDKFYINWQLERKNSQSYEYTRRYKPALGWYFSYYTYSSNTGQIYSRHSINCVTYYNTIANDSWIMLDSSLCGVVLDENSVFKSTNPVRPDGDYPFGRRYYPGFFLHSRKFYPSQRLNKAPHYRASISKLLIDNPGGGARTYNNTYYDSTLAFTTPLFSPSENSQKSILCARNEELMEFYVSRPHFEKSHFFYEDLYTLFPKKFWCPRTAGFSFKSPATYRGHMNELLTGRYLNPLFSATSQYTNLPWRMEFFTGKNRRFLRALFAGAGAVKRGPFKSRLPTLSPAFFTLFVKVNRLLFYKRFCRDLAFDDLQFDRNLAFAKGLSSYSVLFKSRKVFWAFAELSELLTKDSYFRGSGSVMERLFLLSYVRSYFKEISSQFIDHDEKISFSDLGISYSTVRNLGSQRFARVRRRKMWQKSGQWPSVSSSSFAKAFKLSRKSGYKYVI